MPTARSTPNIALIKYWGNRNDELRLPMADSLSMTLNTPAVIVTIEQSDTFRVSSFFADGSQKALTEKDISRFKKHLELTKRFLTKLDAPDALPNNISLTIRSEIPSSIGIASSAAVFSAVAKAMSGLIAPTINLTAEDVSVIARLGSGSAARSIYGGYAAIIHGDGEEIDSSFATQIADEHHWELHDIIIVPSTEAKKIGSTEGHAGAHTSPHFKARIDAMDRRQSECIDAIVKKDFEKLQRVAEEDCMDMHHVMQTQNPPLQYLSDVTHRIINEITDMRTKEHLEVLYTMDAGPTVHLFCTNESRAKILEYAQNQTGCLVFETKVGPGATFEL